MCWLQYQAVSQMLADMAIGVEASRLLCYRGAWEADQGRRNTYYASLAKALSSDVANKSAADAVQVGGSIPLPAHGMEKNLANQESFLSILLPLL